MLNQADEDTTPTTTAAFTTTAATVDSYANKKTTDVFSSDEEISARKEIGTGKEVEEQAEEEEEVVKESEKEVVEEEEEEEEVEYNRPIVVLKTLAESNRDRTGEKEEGKDEKDKEKEEGEEDCQLSEETSKKFERLSRAYEELCKKTITIVHSPSYHQREEQEQEQEHQHHQQQQQRTNMFSDCSSMDSDVLRQSCDTVHDLPSRYSRNNLLPRREDDAEAWKQHLSSPNGIKKLGSKAGDESKSVKPHSYDSCRLVARIVVDTLLSYVRNVGCYLFVVCFVTIVVIHPQPALMSRPAYEIDVVLLLIGSLIFSWQILNVIKQIFKFRISVVQDVLVFNLTDADEFEEIVTQKRSTPPYLTLELKVKKLSTVACFLFGCCTCCRRGIDYLLPKRHCTVLHFDSWFDASHVDRSSSNAATAAAEEGAVQTRGSVFGGRAPSTPHVVIVSKDYRMVDATTSASVEEESRTIKTLFSQDLELDESHVTSEINVDVQEGLRFPDVEAFVVLDPKTLQRGRDNSSRFFARHPFYSPKMLLFFSLLAVDSIYYTIFLLRCLRPTRYRIVKYIRRSALPRLVEESSEQE